MIEALTVLFAIALALALLGLAVLMPWLARRAAAFRKR